MDFEVLEMNCLKSAIRMSTEWLYMTMVKNQITFPSNTYRIQNCNCVGFYFFICNFSATFFWLFIKLTLFFNLARLSLGQLLLI